MDMVGLSYRTMAWAVCLAALAFVALTVGLHRVHRYACREHISSMFYNYRTYRLEHGEHSPTNAEQVASFGGGNGLVSWEANRPAIQRLLTCPGHGRTSSSPAGEAIVSDYIYVNWEPFFGTNAIPDDLPLIYDRHLANHASRGVNVLTTSRFFWDDRARWLRNFATQHPKYHIELPQ